MRDYKNRLLPSRTTMIYIDHYTFFGDKIWNCSIYWHWSIINTDIGGRVFILPTSPSSTAMSPAELSKFIAIREEGSVSKSTPFPSVCLQPIAYGWNSFFKFVKSWHIHWFSSPLKDGVVNDVDDMVEALIKSCGAPLSVVIVGIGPADFSTMVSKW